MEDKRIVEIIGSSDECKVSYKYLRGETKKFPSKIKDENHEIQQMPEGKSFFTESQHPVREDIRFIYGKEEYEDRMNEDDGRRRIEIQGMIPSSEELKFIRRVMAEDGKRPKLFYSPAVIKELKEIADSKVIAVVSLSNESHEDLILNRVKKNYDEALKGYPMGKCNLRSDYMAVHLYMKFIEQEYIKEGRRNKRLKAIKKRGR